MSTRGTPGPGSPDVHQEWDEYAAGYALNALSAGEATMFVTHLEDCERCQASLDDHNLVAAQLGAMAHPSDASEPPSWESMRRSVLGAPREDDLAARRLARSRRRDGSRRILAAAASVAVLAGGGVLAWQLTTTSQSPMTAAGGLVSSCVSTSGCSVVRLDASGGTTAADAADVVVRNGAATVVPAHMPTLQAGRQYVLWQLPRDGRLTAIGDFTRTGNVTTEPATLASGYTDTAAFAISVEKAGALPTRPTTVVAIGSTT